MRLSQGSESKQVALDLERPVEDSENIDIPGVFSNQVRDSVMAVVEDPHLTVCYILVALSKPRVLVQHLHGLVNRKGDSLSRGWILSGDIVVDIAQPELRFCRPGYLRHCRIR